MLKKILLCIALILPTVTLAAPEPVQDVSVSYENGTTTVSWSTEGVSNIQKYNVYYSTESILENQGEYDDFESTDGPASYKEFTNLAGGKYYFSVLAVDKNNQEGAGFISESSIVIPSTNTAQSSAGSLFTLPTKQTTPGASSSSAPAVYGPSLSPNLVTTKNDTVQLLSVDVISANEIKLNFSLPITVSEEGAEDAFVITDPQGNFLRLTKLTIDADDVRLFTETQVKNRVYSVRVSEPIAGYFNAEPLDEEARSVLFTGHNQGSDSDGNNGSVTLDSLEYPADVQNMRINYMRGMSPNTYDITVEWDTPNVTGGLAYYMVSQTHDGGVTYYDPELLVANIGGVQLPGINAPFFGVKVNTVNNAGFVSQGVLKTVQLGVTPSGVSSSRPTTSSSVRSQNTNYVPPVGNVSTAPVTGKTGPTLPSSGTMWSLTIPLSLATVVGIYTWRKRNVRFR